MGPGGVLRRFPAHSLRDHPRLHHADRRRPGRGGAHRGGPRFHHHALIIDPTALKIGDWKEHRACSQASTAPPGLHLHPSGAVAWVLDPLPASVHDAAALRVSGLLDVPASDLPPGAAASQYIGDQGYAWLVDPRQEATRAAPARGRQGLQHLNLPCPLRGRTSHRLPQGLARSTRRL